MVGESNTSISQIPYVERGYRPCVNQPSKDITSDSVELCETAVCFLHIQLIGTNVWCPKIHKIPRDVDFEFSRFRQDQNPETIPVCNVPQCFPT